MAIEGFDELFNIIYIAKKLYDMDKYEIVKESFFDTLDLDMYFEDMYSMIPNLFAYHDCRYYENKMLELHILSDPVIEDFFILAGQYGKRHYISDNENPYIKEAHNQAHSWLNFSYCLDWMLMGHIEPKRKFHSRLGLFISQEDWVDLGCLVYGLVEIYEWFSEQCVILNDLLNDSKLADKPNAKPILSREELKAA